MIAHLRGTVLSISGGATVIDVSGVGYLVHITAGHALALRLGQEVSVHTVLVVREDAQTLYGFDNRDRLEVFELLTGVTGVGPKSALGVLSALSPDQISAAVDSDDDAVFRRVSGIGPKTAKLIVLSLAGKLAAFARSDVAATTGSTAIDAQVVIALVGLGWSERVAEQTVAEVVSRLAHPDAATVSMILRLALAELGPTTSGVRS